VIFLVPVWEYNDKVLIRRMREIICFMGKGFFNLCNPGTKTFRVKVKNNLKESNEFTGKKAWDVG
jgi:hypothetical protein